MKKISKYLPEIIFVAVVAGMLLTSGVNYG